MVGKLTDQQAHHPLQCRVDKEHGGRHFGRGRFLEAMVLGLSRLGSNENGKPAVAWLFRQIGWSWIFRGTAQRASSLPRRETRGKCLFGISKGYGVHTDSLEELSRKRCGISSGVLGSPEHNVNVASQCVHPFFLT